MRRTRRLVKMGAAAARRPSGRVTNVFEVPRERQGAYDFLEERHASARPIVEAIARATCRRAAASGRVVIPIDGTSLHLTDHAKKKGFGPIGPYTVHAPGVKMVTAMAVSSDGTTLGILDQQVWCRPYDASRSVRRGAVKKKRSRSLPTSQKETQHWLAAISASERIFQAHAPHVERTYVLDREGDNIAVLRHLAQTNAGFVVRSMHDRHIENGRIYERGYLREWIAKRPVIGTRHVQVVPAPGRRARVASLAVRAGTVVLHMREGHGTGRLHRLAIGVVKVRELEAPPGEDPIEWTLLTNLQAHDAASANAVVDCYVQRWRIEEFHKTLKSGGCNAEAMQLRSSEAAIKWATILSAVATRIERLKQLARTSPDLPASAELSDVEIRALILMKRRIKKKTETIPDTTPTIAQATWWLAELGGYIGKSSGGPPGAITIGRGLERLLPAAQMLEILEPDR